MKRNTEQRLNSHCGMCTAFFRFSTHQEENKCLLFLPKLKSKWAPSCRDECCDNSLYSLLTRIIWPTSLSLLIFTPVNRQPRATAAGFPVHTNSPSGLLLMLFKTPSALICKFHHLSFKNNRGKPRSAPLLSLRCDLSLWVATGQS